MTKEEILKAVRLCDGFYCKSCPYKKYEDEHYVFRCIHNLMRDIYKLLKDEGMYEELSYSQLFDFY